ncbi:MAG TPA: LpqB family beta-propeller domain-containing protein [Pseudonocardiaceae bacterium]|nr:LpqB family beta-propeller domain-containing protein [Pseudonocardiaceae bacterium]
MRTQRVLPAVVALLAVLVPGCATVPDSSDVQVLRSVPSGPQVAPPAGPTPGASPFRLVRDFIEATGSPANGHAAARAFLTRPAAASWDDDASLTVIEDSPDTPESGPVRGDDRSSVVVRAARIGTLAADGSFTSDAGLSSVVLDLVREDGEWRISNPPPGVLVESTAFQQNYVTVSAWFAEPTSGTLVPDMRWVPAQPDDALAGRALDVLLAGPSEALADAVVSAFPPDARPRSNMLVGPDGRAVIDLAGMGEVGGQERRLAAAQIVSTLDGLVRRPPFQLLADGEPLVAGKPDWRAADITSYTATSGPRPDVPGLVVHDGRLRGLDGAPLPGPAGSGQLTVLTAARSSPEGERLAAVTARPDRTLQLLVGMTGEGLTAVALDAVSMTRPTWRPSGDEVWTVINGTTVAGVALSGSAPAATYQVNAAELAEFGPITELRLSRDGVRVAAVVGGQLVVATVVSRPGEVSIRQPRVLRTGSIPATVSVDWARSDRLVVASSEPAPQVSEMSVDGLVYQPMSSTNLTAPLAGVVAAPGRETIVSDANGLWTYSPSQEVWEPLLGGIGPGAVPLYPG